MGDKVRELCKWKRDMYVQDLKLLRDVIRKPKYFCEKCGRAARKGRWLCRPRPLDD